MCELFSKVVWLRNEHLPLYKSEYNGTSKISEASSTTSGTSKISEASSTTSGTSK